MSAIFSPPISLRIWLFSLGAAVTVMHTELGIPAIGSFITKSRFCCEFGQRAVCSTIMNKDLTNFIPNSLVAANAGQENSPSHRGER